ncbi:MAG: tetratricopeptide repeat protein [Planctomycetota bacterium]|jgi:Flp pilus assembly protein TadD|nr:tetratricopeptide repeat protein [Planctomycetota bacterium]
MSLTKIGSVAARRASGVLTLGVLCVLSLTACQNHKKVAKANGSTVLTVAQYNALAAKMKAGAPVASAEATPNAAAGDTFGLAAALYQNHDYAGAAREFENVTGGNPDHSQAWYMLGASYEHLGDIERAQTAFKKSYDLLVAQGYIVETGGLR